MRTLKELHVRRLELEKLSDYHRQLLLDSIEDNAASLRLIEGVAFLAANPAVVKMISMPALAAAIPALLKKLWPAFSGVWGTAGGAVRVASVLARLVSGFVGLVLFFLRCAGRVLEYFLKNRARRGSGGARSKTQL